jgi:hypothetical protein
MPVSAKIRMISLSSAGANSSSFVDLVSAQDFDDPLGQAAELRLAGDRLALRLARGEEPPDHRHVMVDRVLGRLALNLILAAAKTAVPVIVVGVGAPTLRLPLPPSTPPPTAHLRRAQREPGEVALAGSASPSQPLRLGQLPSGIDLLDEPTEEGGARRGRGLARVVPSMLRERAHAAG